MRYPGRTSARSNCMLALYLINIYEKYIKIANYKVFLLMFITCLTTQSNNGQLAFLVHMIKNHIFCYNIYVPIHS